MNKTLFEKAKKYGIYAVLATALLISAVISTMLRKNDSKRVIIYSDNNSGNSSEYEYSIKNKDHEGSDRTTNKAKTTKDKNSTSTKHTTSRTSKTSKVKTSKTQTSRADETKVINFPIDINIVTYEELTAINGIGGGTAEAILAFRNRVGVITYMEQLLEISGIGESKLDLLKNYLYVDDADYSPPEVTYVDLHTDVPEEDTTIVSNVTEPPEEPSSSADTIPSIKERSPVNINEANKEELMECLLIDEELAIRILEIRDKLGGMYENSLQLLYVDGISKQMLSEMKEYVLLE